MITRLRPSVKPVKSTLGVQSVPVARSHARHFRSSTRGCNSHEQRRTYAQDPRLESLGKVIKDEYAVVRDSYDTPKHPIVLAHGLLGFDELRLAGPYLPGVQYWRGIKEALSMKGVQVITATVPPSGSIEMRAEELARDIAVGAQGKDVNIIAHSMIGDDRLAQLYYALGLLKVETGAFSQLTREYMENTFNPNTPDVDDVRYFSYGASMQPSFWSVFRQSHRILEQLEGFNDGLVSVASSRWGGEAGYKGTLLDVSHLDLINWSNRLKWLAGEITGNRRRFNAIALYLDIADMLAKEGL
ncbi:lipase 2 [Aspergillus melleus]|uniref:Lipase 2 n=1 Tax=Aspergillus melleus TaxID=138277 RepID=A0ACC3BGX8_9EURO|nr:lipase 2 [Aspergillus melleus]